MIPDLNRPINIASGTTIGKHRNPFFDLMQVRK